MAKFLKDILEVAEPKAGDEKRFKEKHIVQDNPYPAKGTDDVLNARKAKKDKTKLSHMSKEEEEDMYEDVGVDFNSYMSGVESLLDEDDLLEIDGDEFAEGVVETIQSIVSSGSSDFVLLDDGTEIEVDTETASSIAEVLGALTQENRDKFVDTLGKDQESFLRMVDFAISMRGE